MTENFVLVHGAWHGGWAWQPVASRLRAAGHRVWAPTCPGLGIDDDPRGVTLAGCVDSLVSQVEASFAVDITLVGHSWGGYVIAGAVPRLASRLTALVFWSAFVPEAGRPLYDEVPPPYQELFSQLAGASADNTVALPLEVFQGAFMGDADPAAAAAVHSVLRPQPFRTFTDPPAGDDSGAGLGAHLSDLVEGGVHVREVRHDGERPVPFQFFVVVNRVGGEDDRPGPVATVAIAWPGGWPPTWVSSMPGATCQDRPTRVSRRNRAARAGG